MHIKCLFVNIHGILSNIPTNSLLLNLERGLSRTRPCTQSLYQDPVFIFIAGGIFSFFMQISEFVTDFLFSLATYTRS